MSDFKTRNGKKLPYPIFFPDATRGVVRSVDSVDISGTQTPGVLVNTYHLYLEVGSRIIKKHGDVRKFMNWDGAVISDSGGFQIMSLIKNKTGSGKVTDKGVVFRPSKKRRILFTPEKSIQYQMKLQTDLLVVLDDFTPPGVTREQAEETVARTIDWAKRCKIEFERICKEEKIKNKPYLIAVIQGGDHQDLRKECAKALVDIGFDGYGYGGWPVLESGEFDYKTANTIVENTPKGSLLYGLGIGKPQEVVNLVKLGYQIFDCVLPTRDARHKRLYVYNAESIKEINVHSNDFYSYYVPDKQKYANDNSPVSKACDCLLCTTYSKSYLAHLFRIGDTTALRLATIHNLRFYSILMEKLR